MNLVSDTNMIVARIKNMATPAAKMECGLEVVSMANAANEAVRAYTLGHKAAIADRRFQIASSVINGIFAHQHVCDSEAEDKVIKQAIRVATKLAMRLDDIEQKEFEDFQKLE